MTVSNSRLALPGRGLLMLWLVLILLAFAGWGVVAHRLAPRLRRLRRASLAGFWLWGSAEGRC